MISYRLCALHLLWSFYQLMPTSGLGQIKQGCHPFKPTVAPHRARHARFVRCSVDKSHDASKVLTASHFRTGLLWVHNSEISFSFSEMFQIRRCWNQIGPTCSEQPHSAEFSAKTVQKPSRTFLIRRRKKRSGINSNKCTGPQSRVAD